MYLTLTAEENVKVEEGFGSREGVMHEEKIEEDYSESECDFPPRRYPLREENPKAFSDHIVYRTVTSSVQGEPKTRTVGVTGHSGQCNERGNGNKCKKIRFGN